MKIKHLDQPKNILVLSYGPVPTPDFQKIEGGGMRCWGLATGLRDNGHNVTVSVFQEFKQKYSTHEGIRLHNWVLNNDFKDYINSFDAVIVSYSMGDLSVFVADQLSHHVTLVLDCYVPIFIEISARDSDDKASELKNYLFEVERFNHVLKRGDFFICANETQKHMYAGILGSLGILNPHSYGQDRLLVVPFGVDSKALNQRLITDNPYQVKANDFVLLWFGGLYPWFNFEPLIKAVTELSKNPKFKFYLVGGKNPYNNHPDFVKQYDYVLEEFKKIQLLDKSVFLVDWVDFDDRIRWFKNANLVVSINSPGEENIYSWRTRVMDFLWGELPMITNGGDPLSDELISNGAGIKTGLLSEDIVSHINHLIEDPKSLLEIRQKLLKIKSKYHWEKVTKELSDRIASDDSLPYFETLAFIEDNKISRLKSKRKISKVFSKLNSYTMIAKQKGIKRSGKFVAHTLKSAISVQRTNPRQKAFFISHPIDDTGAPLVLLDIINDFNEFYDDREINIVAPAIKRNILNSLLSKKYKIHKMVDGIGGRIIQAGLRISKDDFVLMNTLAVYKNYKEYFFWMLESGRLNHAHWFIHEDNPTLHFADKREVARIKRLIASDKLTILVPSKQTADEYNHYFDTDRVQAILLRVQVPPKFQAQRTTSDFDTIRFFISGNPLDGRKGQLFFLAALQLFEANYRTTDPNQYRPYTLDLVAIGNDYISEQITSIGKAILGDNINIHPVVSREKALEITFNCNVTVCSSLNETFAIFVAEGMLMGHPIIRNNTSGWQEQIMNNKNGFIFNTLDINRLTECIRKILDRDLSNETLLKMSKESQKISSTFNDANYYNQIIKLNI